MKILKNFIGQEGFDSGNNTEFMRFLRYSQRSCSEVLSMTYILKDIYDLDVKEIYDDVVEERKQIKGFIKYLKNN